MPCTGLQVAPEEWSGEAERRRGPLEDSGGFPGYEEIMDALADASHPDHAKHAALVAEMTRSDAPFDPAFLDIPAVNGALAELF